MTLKELRIALGLSQKDCSDLVKMPLRTYQNYENDEKKVGTIKYDFLMSKLTFIFNNSGDFYNLNSNFSNEYSQNNSYNENMVRENFIPNKQNAIDEYSQKNPVKIIRKKINNNESVSNDKKKTENLQEVFSEQNNKINAVCEMIKKEVLAKEEAPKGSVEDAVLRKVASVNANDLLKNRTNNSQNSEYNKDYLLNVFGKKGAEANSDYLLKMFPQKESAKKISDNDSGYINTGAILTVAEIEKACKEVFKEYDIQYCYLFGAYVTGKPTPSSDVDICLSSNVPQNKFSSISECLWNKLHKNVKLVSMSALTENVNELNFVLNTGIKII